AQIDGFLQRVTKSTGFLHPELACGQARLDFKVYGKNGVMGDLERSEAAPHEIAVLGEVTAPTRELATSICTTARVGVLHRGYKDQIATAGNLALPLNPVDIPVGPVCAFTVYHVMEGPPSELFPIGYRTVGGR